ALPSYVQSVRDAATARPALGSALAEEERHQAAERLVQPHDEEHHERDEPDDHRCVVPHLGARRSDDLAQLVDDLADEEHEPSDRALLPLAGIPFAGVALTRTHVGHSSHRFGRADKDYAGQEGLEPPTAGFGDRCSTN